MMLMIMYVAYEAIGGKALVAVKTSSVGEVLKITNLFSP